MSLLTPHSDDAPHGSRSSLPGVLLGILLVAGVAALGVWLLRPSAPPVEEAPAAVEAPPPAVDPVPETDARVPDPTPPSAPARRVPRAPAAPVEERAEVVVPAGPELRVTSDVEGASVFIDRRYLGTTPLVTREVEAGTRMLNVSAEGHEGVARTIEVASDGPTAVDVRLRDVRLDTTIAVVHKHRMGRCEGRLVASVDGLRYETSNPNDGFTIGFAQVETFAIDYLEVNLRVKQRNGRTWNFTDPDGNADRLFVFHRDVEQARARLGR